MDLPQLMMACGTGENALLESQIIMANIKDKDIAEKEIWNVWLELDLDTGSVRFVPFAYQRENSEKEFYYLGNNKAAAQQIFAVREASSMMNFWTGRMEGILSNIRKWSLLPARELKELLDRCAEEGLFTEKGIDFKHIEGLNSSVKVSTENNKKLSVDGKEVAADRWLAEHLGAGKKQKLSLIIPCIMCDGKRIVISRHPDYQVALQNFFSGSSQNEGKNAKKKLMQICHICGRSTDTVNTIEYASKLDRSSISKVFVTTPINYASGFEKKNHQKNFAICQECYEKWRGAEKAVMNNYRVRIAGENAVVLTEGILQPIDRDGLSRINHKIDIAFDQRKFRDWIEEVTEDYMEDQGIDPYEFNLIFYQTNGKSCYFYYTIEDVQGIWFDTILTAFKQVRTSDHYAHILPYFNLSSIYGMIPVREYGKDKKKDIHKTLDIYSRFLRGQNISGREIFEQFAEAMDKGHRTLISSEIRNYSNLQNIRRLHERMLLKDIHGLEWYIQYMCYAYQGLIEVLARLELTEKKGENDMADTAGNLTGKEYEFIKTREEFLQRMQYSDTAKGFYYIGAMMYQVGQMQYVQGHKNKPILEKINYSGMSVREVMELLNELHDKIRQYRKAMEAKNRGALVFVAEKFSERVYEYVGNLPQKVNLDEHETLFYIMSGYSGCISLTKNENEEDKEND